MNFTDTDLRTWDRRRLRVGREKRSRLLAQVATLIGKLEKAIPANSPFKVVRFRRAGSLRKATALHPRGDTGIDADVAVYLDDSNASYYDLLTMHNTLRAIVRGVYPTKQDDDFWVQPHTLGVQFRASGLKVDLVPLLALPGQTEEAWMVTSNGTRAHKTDIPAHVAFVRELANADDRFRPLVRMCKAWRNNVELGDELGSFAIELILAHLHDTRGAPISLEDGLQRYFLYVAQTGLNMPILSGNGASEVPNAPVVILDPANPSNNVTSRMTESDRQAIVSAATVAWERLITAHHNGYKGETLALWREVFGSTFSVEPEEIAA
ncbi:MAG: CBASS oligonucleotide cyclase [Solirubrobacteraceae bacterium]|jgi:tRNA nucleotidyltransferase (CCA-adding enzyme)